jgi:hypothetical protein
MVAYFPGITAAGTLAPGLAAATVRNTLELGSVENAAASVLYLPLAGGTLTGPITGTSNLIEQRNGTNGQQLSIAKTYTSATSFEQLELDAASDASNYRIGSRIGSLGGSTRGLQIGAWDAAGTFASAANISTANGTLSIPFKSTGVERYVLSAFANFGREFGLYIDASGNEGGFKANSVFQLKANTIICLTGSAITSIGSLSESGRISSVDGHLFFGSDSNSRTYARGPLIVGSSTVSGDTTVRLEVNGFITSTSNLTIVPSASRTLATNNQFTFERVSNTEINLVYRGDDGTTRRLALPGFA